MVSANRSKNAVRRHNIKNIYDYPELLSHVKQHSNITPKNEWIYHGSFSAGYPRIKINRKSYMLHRLILANKNKKLYEDIDVARHILPDGSKPNKRDVNPEHLFEGSRKDNSIDSLDYSKSVKIKPEIVSDIKGESKLIDISIWGAKTRFDKKWASKLGVRPNTIASIRREVSWTSR